MEAVYKPQIAYQGCLMVSPDGTLHSPLAQIVNSEHNFMLLHPDEFTVEGIQKAVATTRGHIDIAASDAGHNTNISVFIWNKLTKRVKVIVAQEMQERGLLHDFPKIKKLLKTMDMDAIHDALNKKYPGFANRKGDPFYAESEQLAIEKRDDLMRDGALFLPPLLGKIPSAADEDYTKLMDALLRENHMDFKVATQSLLSKRLDAIEQDPQGFLDSCKEQMQQFRRTWRHNAADLTRALKEHKKKIEYGSYGVSGAGFIPFITAIIMGEANPLIVPGVVASTASMGGAALTWVADALDVRMQRQLSHAMPYSDRKREKLAEKLEKTVELLPERMQLLLRHYDPVSFIADSARHVRGGEEAKDWGTYFPGTNLVFFKADMVSNYTAVFEEYAHLIHNHILSREQITAFAPAYEADMQRPKAREFFKEHAYKGIIEEYNEKYDKAKSHNFGGEVIEELCRIEDKLVKEGKTSGKARKLIVNTLPQLGKLYTAYLAAEEQLYQRSLKSDETAEHMEITTIHRDRLEERVLGRNAARE